MAIATLTLLLASGTAVAQITVQGLTNQTVYADQVTFRVVTATGYDYTALLNGTAVAVGTSVTVNEPEYYELAVTRRNQTSGAVENLLIQFIVRSSERRNAEWGLPPWTPYPAIPSAAAEFAGSNLTLVTPAAYPQGLEIPVVGRVTNASDKLTGVCGELKNLGTPAHSFKIYRGVGYGFLAPATSAGTIAYEAAIGPLQRQKQIAIEASTSWTNVSGTIPTTNWGENARIAVTGDLTVGATSTLTIGAGSVIRLAAGVEVFINGKIVVNGTLERPVVFTCGSRSQPWGGIVLRASTSVGEMTGAIMTGSGADPDWFDNNPGSGDAHIPNEPLVYLSNGARATLTDCFLIDNQGQGGHAESSTLTFIRCLLQKALVGGQYNGGTVRFENSAVIGIPDPEAPFADDDGDAIYFTGGSHHVIDCLVGWAHDDGIDAGSGSAGPVEVTRTWMESNYHEGYAWSESRLPTMRGCVAMNCGQGIEAGWNSPQVDAADCLSIANVVGARFGDNYDWDYNGTLKVRNSILLHNKRNVWGRAWDNWQVHLSQMDVQQNYLSEADPLFPNNMVWDPIANAALLAPFMRTPAGTVGIGIATRSTLLDRNLLSKGVPVRISTFTTQTVSIDYAVDTDAGNVGGGTLTFLPGETVKIIPISIANPDAYTFIRATISNPVRAEITGIPSASFAGPATTILVPRGSEWKYWDKSAAPGAGWRSLSFVETGWLSGFAELGYGDDDEATVIQGGPDDARYPAAYFRHAFDVENPASYSALEVRIRRDDGAVVYLNEQEIFRTNMPQSTISHTTWASGNTASETTFYTNPVPADVLVAGTNILAVEVHQANETSSDLSFNLELAGTRSAPLPPSFVRGDANGDRRIDISDAVATLLVLFASRTTDCEDALDANDDGALNVADPVYILAYLFARGPDMPAPFPTAGQDPGGDTLAECSRR